ncbi:YceK/YidQ family lipoprotein [Pseudomonas purpurea]|uniref:YceK/YidQ family lipoprotein n=1 Tax=Pseudomonas purpurea TaxID=3136737 RepID=UPI003265718F
MKRTLRLGVVLGLMASVAGCGTMLGRLGAESQADYYKGVDGGLMLLGVNKTGGEGSPAGILCYVSLVCPLVTVVSLPVDAALDTVFLPIDYVNTL